MLQSYLAITMRDLQDHLSKRGVRCIAWYGDSIEREQSHKRPQSNSSFHAHVLRSWCEATGFSPNPSSVSDFLIPEGPELGTTTALANQADVGALEANRCASNGLTLTFTLATLWRRALGA